MNPEPPFASPPDQVEEAIFNTAGDLVDPQARAIFLDRTCAHDGVLRRRIETLLRAQVIQYALEGNS